MSQLTHYRVEHADTLRSIAYRFYKDGDKWPVVFRHNKHYIADPNVLTPGQIIVIPHVVHS